MESWTLDELVARAESWLSELGLLDLATDGRVARAADARTVRYYQGLGLIDKPISYEGHKARYGSRQLKQLVAIKALQRRRLPLAEIQEQLYGRTDEELEALLSSLPPPEPVKLPVSTVREVVLAPGLKLVAQPGFRGDPAALVEVFKAALAALGEG